MRPRGMVMVLTYVAVLLSVTISAANAPDDPPKPPAVGGPLPPRPPAPVADVPNLGTDPTSAASSKAIRFAH